jgi:hypothetical protein
MVYAGECTAEKEERGRKRESGGRKERADQSGERGA